MLQHPGNGISLESYDEEVGFFALMHIYKAKRMERASPAKGMTECLSNYFSSCSFLSSTTPSRVPLPLCRRLTGLCTVRGTVCCCDLWKSVGKALYVPTHSCKPGCAGQSCFGFLSLAPCLFHQKWVCIICEILCVSFEHCRSQKAQIIDKLSMFSSICL